MRFSAMRWPPSSIFFRLPLHRVFFAAEEIGNPMGNLYISQIKIAPWKQSEKGKKSSFGNVVFSNVETLMKSSITHVKPRPWSPTRCWKPRCLSASMLWIIPQDWFVIYQGAVQTKISGMSPWRFQFHFNCRHLKDLKTCTTWYLWQRKKTVMGNSRCLQTISKHLHLSEMNHKQSVLSIFTTISYKYCI